MLNFILYVLLETYSTLLHYTDRE